MILTCPSCRTRYAVPDRAIGSDGRRVRCAQCRHSWFQDGPADPAFSEAPVAPPRPNQAPAAHVAEAKAVPRAAEQPQAPPPPRPVADETIYGWEEEAAPEPRRARRNPARVRTALAVLAAVLMVGAILLLQTVGLPGIAARVGLARPGGTPAIDLSGRGTPEQLPGNRQLLSVTGEVRNMTDEVQRVPQIRAEVLDADGRVIHAWSIAPPVQQLPPRGTAPFNSASTDVPVGGRSLNLRFGPIT